MKTVFCLVELCGIWRPAMWSAPRILYPPLHLPSPPFFSTAVCNLLSGFEGTQPEAKTVIRAGLVHFFHLTIAQELFFCERSSR